MKHDVRVTLLYHSRSHLVVNTTLQSDAISDNYNSKTRNKTIVPTISDVSLLQTPFLFLKILEDQVRLYANVGVLGMNLQCGSTGQCPQ